MNRFTKLLPICLAGVLTVSAPLAVVHADEVNNTVTTPGERQDTVQQTTHDQRKLQLNQQAQQAQERARSWKNMTPDQRHDAYGESAQQVRSQAHNKAVTAQQRKQNWSQMSSEERLQLIGTKQQNVQGNIQYRHEGMKNKVKPRSGYGVSGWNGRR